MGNQSLKFKLLLTKIVRELKIRGTAIPDWISYQFSRLRPTPQSDPTTIYYLGKFIPARAGRMSKYLRRMSDYRSVLICHVDGYSPLFAQDNFDDVKLYRNKWQLRRILHGIGDAKLYHTFAPTSEYPNVARKYVSVPVLHDTQDVLVTYYGLTPNQRFARIELPHEREMLAKADGIIAQCPETTAGIRMYGIPHKERPKNMYFGLYCDHDVFQPFHPKDTAKEIHFCYAGSVAGSHRSNQIYGILKFHNFIEQTSAQGMHFHMYPSPTVNKTDVEDYQRIAKDNPFFHLHEPVAQSELAKELSQYTFGVLPFFREDSGLKDEKMKYSTTLKMYNYMEAGLPTIISLDLYYQSWLMMRGGAAIGIKKKDLVNLKQIIQDTDYTQLQENIRSYREELSLNNNMDRLLAFYESF